MLGDEEFHEQCHPGPQGCFGRPALREESWARPGTRLDLVRVHRHHELRTGREVAGDLPCANAGLRRDLTHRSVNPEAMNTAAAAKGAIGRSLS